MRVAFFLPHIVDGGVTRSTTNLAQMFIKDGYTADFIGLKIQGEMSQYVEQVGINIINLEVSRTILSVIKLKRYLEQNTPEILITSQHYANIVGIWARIISKHKPKLIVTERVAIVEALRQDPWHKRYILKLLMKLFYNRADAVVSNSIAGARMLEQLLNWPLHSVHSIYNVIDFDQIKKTMSKTVKHPFINQKTPLIVSVGRLEYQKGFELLLQAVAQLKNKLECNLIIIGNGSLKESLNKLTQKLHLEKNVSFIEFDINPHAYIKQADLFVLSSRYEGLGNVLIEAQGCNTLVVATDCPTGPREILMDGKAGILVPPNDADALAKAILKAFQLSPEESDNLKRIASLNLSRFEKENVYNSYVTTVQN